MRFSRRAYALAVAYKKNTLGHDCKEVDGANRVCRWTLGCVPYDGKKFSPVEQRIAARIYLCTGNSFAQAGSKEPAAVVELGAAAEPSLTEAQSSFGPTAAVEFTPIENWLELQASVMPLFRRPEWTTDLLFKKPWTLSDKNEFMLGVGLE